MSDNNVGAPQGGADHGPHGQGQAGQVPQVAQVIHSAAAPQGWYADGTGPSTQRWWDGARWTDHTFDTATGAYGAPGAASAPYSSVGAPSELSPGTSPYTPMIWVMVLLPLLTLVAFLTWDFTGFVTAITNEQLTATGTASSATSAAITSALFSPSYFAVIAIGWGTFIASVILAYFDHRRLGRRGFARRFHWAWSFFGGYGSLIYIIGRSVIVKSQVGRGMSVMWAFIGVEALLIVVLVIKFAIAFTAIAPLFSTNAR